MDFKRVSRKRTELREIYFENKFSPYAEGSCLVKFGNTHVICTASIEEREFQCGLEENKEDGSRQNME